MNNSESIVVLNMVPEIGPIRFKNLQNQFGNMTDVFKASLLELRSVEGITETIARSILSYGKNLSALAEKEFLLAKQNKIAIITIDNPDFPAILKTMNDPPPVLYCLGDPSCLHDSSIALVGTRRPTPYGERIAEMIARDLTQIGIPTVSGLARGIDTIVHKATIRFGGRTIAVLGSGLLKIYPPENRKLSVDLSASGALISEFPLLLPPDPGHFPRRNRIIAGLSLGTVVIEADEKSGALITANIAAEQGKDIFAVPGPVTSKMSRGPHKLIRQGAKLVERCQDIIEEISDLKDRLFPKLTGMPSTQKLSTDSATATMHTLSSQEQQLLNFIYIDPIHIDTLSQRSSLPQGDFSHTLLNLEMKGVIRSLPGKMYVRS